VNAPAKLAGFAAALPVLFGGGALAGGVLDPRADGAAAAPHVSRPAAGARMAMPASGHDGRPGVAGDADAVRGLAVAGHGLRVVVENPELPRARSRTLRWRIVDDRGETVRDFDVEHTRRMHLILARRDLTGFQHLHPRQARDGSWSARVRLAAAGSYRMFADFSHAGRPETLASDLRVDGSARLEPLPAPAASAISDGGYAVRLEAGRARAGRESDLRFAVTRGGRSVHTEPYLGAGGHLVALREGDLAFLHVHPGEPAHRDGDPIGFMTTFPTAGRYRLFLQFEVRGRVQTAAFTHEVGER
jgi:hypothetical protein